MVEPFSAEYGAHPAPQYVFVLLAALTRKPQNGSQDYVNRKERTRRRALIRCCQEDVPNSVHYLLMEQFVPLLLCTQFLVGKCSDGNALL